MNVYASIFHSTIPQYIILNRSRRILRNNPTFEDGTRDRGAPCARGASIKLNKWLSRSSFGVIFFAREALKVIDFLSLAHRRKSRSSRNTATRRTVGTELTWSLESIHPSRRFTPSQTATIADLIQVSTRIAPSRRCYCIRARVSREYIEPA